ncbi:hypothetical protein GCM10023084_07820 [Streptomyces lacrimifluminis]|uniref:Uncharacterized protein n=1 Tax=Streptomyces lacrimifluminis TaxID=1500077 RepID=A0A917NT19_9ACTN|nr:hypothetical protein [Streptomyces lacrimifluminis]GGJ25057.1 hypothetical protein GCM10012282_22060 [Streptomyces lacrimifluminis]
MTQEEIEALARQIAALLPGYLLYRDPPQVAVGSPESEVGAGSTEITAVEVDQVAPNE